MTLETFSVREDWVMPEYKRYIITLRVVDPSTRDKFRMLSRPESFFEIRPNRRPGQRGAYSVEMTQSEYEAALEDAEDPQSNLIVIEPNQRMMQSEPPPGTAVTQYAAMQDAGSLGLTGAGVVVGIIDNSYGPLLSSYNVKAAKGFGNQLLEDGSGKPIDPYGSTNLSQPEHGAHMLSLAIPPQSSVAAAGYNSTIDTWAAASYWLVDEVGVDIISNSQYLLGDPTVLKDAVTHLRSKNVLLFASAGNGGLDNTGDGENVITYPAAAAGANAISNYRPSTDSKASTSNYGSKIWAAAPGSEVYVKEPDGSTTYVDDAGTSAAAAVASNIAARLMSGGQSPGNVESYLASTARKTGASPLYEGAGVLQLSAAEQALQQDKPDKIDLGGATSPGEDGSTQDGTGDPDPGACG